MSRYSHYTHCFQGESTYFGLRASTVEPLITVTSAQRPSHDLRSVKKVPARSNSHKKTFQQRSPQINGQMTPSYCPNV